MIVPAGAQAIADAAAHLRAGRLVAFPTETVYGLGADATSDDAVRAIYQAKGRPSHNPLIVHVPDLEAAAAIVELDERARLLAAAFWPGPLTMVLPRRAPPTVAPSATAGLATIAVRVPGHPVAQALLRTAGLPIVAPSANPSGRISPTSADHVDEDLGHAVAMILDGGPCAVGLESTVVDLSDPHRATLLRPGGIPRGQLEAILGRLDDAHADPMRPAAPGMLASHYAPRLPLRLNACAVLPHEALIGFGADAPQGGIVTFNLSSSGDLVEAAANLFAALRLADRSGATAIAVVAIEGHGLAEAIRDRLRRAAAPRP